MSAFLPLVMTASTPKATNIVWHEASVDRAARADKRGHRSAILWFTGLSGSGKSTLANAVNAALFERGLGTYVLDGDNVRHGLCKTWASPTPTVGKIFVASAKSRNYSSMPGSSFSPPLSHRSGPTETRHVTSWKRVIFSRFSALRI